MFLYSLRHTFCTDPEPYAGQPDLCRGFLFQCRSVFQQRPARFPTDAAKTRYVCGLLRGRALQWAEARFASSALDNTDFEIFLNEFKLRVLEEEEEEGAGAS
uniref:DUF4939 domain-containing protein n=1 Tax=Periophthalmus magnuspinnatus TaxID=409849 RepID=A0A3B4AIZ6_9GOBI